MLTFEPSHLRLKQAFQWLVRHQLAWLVVGTIYGVVAAPVTQALSVLAFIIAGWICCTVLSVLTIATSRYASLIIAGGSCGLMLGLSCEFLQLAEPDSIAKSLCLIIGALVGATSRLWSIPILMGSQVVSFRPFSVICGWFGARAVVHAGETTRPESLQNP